MQNLFFLEFHHCDQMKWLYNSFYIYIDCRWEFPKEFGADWMHTVLRQLQQNIRLVLFHAKNDTFYGNGFVFLFMLYILRF